MELTIKCWTVGVTPCDCVVPSSKALFNKYSKGDRSLADMSTSGSS